MLLSFASPKEKEPGAKGSPGEANHTAKYRAP